MPFDETLYYINYNIIDEPSNDIFWETKSGKAIRNMLVGILFFIFVICYVIFLTCFGACMELAIFYLKNKVFAIIEKSNTDNTIQEQDEEEIIPTNILSYDTKAEAQRIKGKDTTIICFLIILGFAVQPFYIIYKIVKYLLVLYHKFGFLWYDCSCDCTILMHIMQGSGWVS